MKRGTFELRINVVVPVIITGEIDYNIDKDMYVATCGDDIRHSHHPDLAVVKVLKDKISTDYKLQIK